VASMSKKDKDIITEELGVEPVLFDAALVSAQSRKRLFWTNIKFDLPPDRGILLKDILQPDAEVGESMTVEGKSFCLTTEKAEKAKGKNKFIQIGYIGESNHCKVGGQALRIYSNEGKSTTSGVGLYLCGHKHLRRLDENGVRHDGDTQYPLVKRYEFTPTGKAITLTTMTDDKLVVINPELRIRKLTPIECERLQSLPDGYTEGIAKTHRYRCIGNAFNVDVVAHILTHLPH
jgi:DNA (cytosine-5)-methyltransferase 3A